jgi:hypothetical protein
MACVAGTVSDRVQGRRGSVDSDHAELQCYGPVSTASGLVAEADDPKFLVLVGCDGWVLSQPGDRQRSNGGAVS